MHAPSCRGEVGAVGNAFGMGSTSRGALATLRASSRRRPRPKVRAVHRHRTEEIHAGPASSPPSSPCCCLPLAAVGELPKDVQQQLATSKFVYIHRPAKTATLEQAGGDLVPVARRRGLRRHPVDLVARAPYQGRSPAAKIAVGKADGPSFMATGSLVNDPTMRSAVALKTFAEKYPDGWAARTNDNFRDGFKDGVASW